MKFEIKTDSRNGYTLIETIVAMALFLSVLIPLIGTMGIIMFDRKPAMATKALMLAQSEMSTTVARQDYIDATKTSEPGLTVIKEIKRYNTLVDIRISIKAANDQTKELIVLKKIVYE
jgi:prepilin-type N-terminal cleavage/methylation domain-containing protein